MQNSELGDVLKYFVTCSEDQTCKVWKLKDKRNSDTELKAKAIDTLKGHERAVTDMAWFKMAPDVLGEHNPHLQLFASCSDDQTVRLYAVDISGSEPDFTFFKSLDTKFIEEWHTITYMAVEEGGSRLAISTQNGYLVIWDLAGVYSEEYEANIVFNRRVHAGSIEGLKWKAGKVCVL